MSNNAAVGVQGRLVLAVPDRIADEIETHLCAGQPSLRVSRHEAVTLADLLVRSVLGVGDALVVAAGVVTPEQLDAIDVSCRRQAVALLVLGQESSCQGHDHVLHLPMTPDEFTGRLKIALELAGLRRCLVSCREQQERLMQTRLREVEDSRVDTLFRLGKASEFRDKGTGSHVFRVGIYAKVLAETLGLERSFVRRLFLATPLHDVGKIGIPDEILLKPGRLEADEWAVMRGHCEIGAQLLSEAVLGMDVYSDLVGRTTEATDHGELRTLAATIALTHHERWDGAGYPRGLRGNDIPMAGRIVAVADVYDAMLSPRPYKRAHEESVVAAMIESTAGEHFDPAVVAAFSLARDAFQSIHARYPSPPLDLREWLSGVH